MVQFGKDALDSLKRHRVAMGQGTEDKTFPEIMAEIPPEERSAILRGMVAGFAKAETVVDPERRANIERMNALNNTHFLHGIDAGIPAIDRTMEAFLVRKEWPQVQVAANAVTTWMIKGGPGLLTLSGPTGCGKTHLAIAAARQLYADAKPIIYREESPLISELHRHIGPNTVEEFWDEVKTIPWLVIDDYGVAALNPFSKGKMDELINARWKGSENLRTLITTNLTSETMEPRIASRLADKSLALTVMIQAKDYRRESR